jgi:hypothetical protein
MHSSAPMNSTVACMGQMWLAPAYLNNQVSRLLHCRSVRAGVTLGVAPAVVVVANRPRCRVPAPGATPLYWSNIPRCLVFEGPQEVKNVLVAVEAAVSYAGWPYLAEPDCPSHPIPLQPSSRLGTRLLKEFLLGHVRPLRSHQAHWYVSVFVRLPKCGKGNSSTTCAQRTRRQPVALAVFDCRGGLFDRRHRLYSVSVQFRRG